MTRVSRGGVARALLALTAADAWRVACASKALASVAATGALMVRSHALIHFAVLSVLAAPGSAGRGPAPRCWYR